MKEGLLSLCNGCYWYDPDTDTCNAGMNYCKLVEEEEMSEYYVPEPEVY